MGAVEVGFDLGDAAGGGRRFEVDRHERAEEDENEVVGAEEGEGVRVGQMVVEVGLEDAVADAADGGYHELEESSDEGHADSNEYGQDPSGK